MAFRRRRSFRRSAPRRSFRAGGRRRSMAPIRRRGRSMGRRSRRTLIIGQRF